MNRLLTLSSIGLVVALSVAACGGRTGLEIGAGGAPSATGPSATIGVGANGGGQASSCEPRSTWIARAGGEEGLESADALVALDDCSVVVAGDVEAGVFVNRYDGAGDLVMSRSFTGGSQLAPGIDVDDVGNLYVAVEIWGSVDFGDHVLQSMGQWDMVLLSLTSNGTTRFSRLFGGPDYQQVSDIAVDPAGNVLLAGEVSGAVDFGGGVLTPRGSWDIALARFDRDGNHQWSRLATTSSSKRRASRWPPMAAPGGPAGLPARCRSPIRC